MGCDGCFGIEQFLLKNLRECHWVFQIIVIAGAAVGNGGHQLLVEIVSHPNRADRKFFFKGNTGHCAEPGGIRNPFIGKPIGNEDHLSGISIPGGRYQQVYPRLQSGTQVGATTG